MWWAFPLQSAERWSGSARAPPATSSCWSLPLQASILLHHWPPSFLCVPVEEFLAVWPWAVGLVQAVLGTSCLSPTQPPWCYTAFSWPPAAQPLAAGGPPPGHTFCRLVCQLPLPQEKDLGTFCSLRSALQPLPVWEVAWATSGVDGADPPARVAACALRQAPTILPWGSGRMSAVDLCGWSQNGAWLLGYVCFKTPSCLVEYPSFKDALSLHAIPHQLPHHAPGDAPRSVCSAPGC